MRFGGPRQKRCVLAQRGKAVFCVGQIKETLKTGEQIPSTRPFCLKPLKAREKLSPAKESQDNVI